MDVESEGTLGVGDGQGGLACCDSWGRKESDTTEQLNWTEHIGFIHTYIFLLYMPYLLLICMYHICAYEYAYHMQWYIYTHSICKYAEAAHLLHLITWSFSLYSLCSSHMSLLEQHPRTSISTPLQFHSFNLEYSSVYFYVLCFLISFRY